MMLITTVEERWNQLKFWSWPALALFCSSRVSQQEVDLQWDGFNVCLVFTSVSLLTLCSTLFTGAPPPSVADWDMTAAGTCSISLQSLGCLVVGLVLLPLEVTVLTCSSSSSFLPPTWLRTAEVLPSGILLRLPWVTKSLYWFGEVWAASLRKPCNSTSLVINLMRSTGEGKDCFQG